MQDGLITSAAAKGQLLKLPLLMARMVDVCGWVKGRGQLCCMHRTKHAEPGPQLLLQSCNCLEDRRSHCCATLLSHLPLAVCFSAARM